MIRKLSLLMTIVAAIGLIVALSGCGRKAPLEPPPEEARAASLPYRA